MWRCVPRTVEPPHFCVQRRPGDWPTFNRTLAGDRFSPLAEIDRSNVARLRVVCRYALPEVTALQTGPIVVGGTMYFTTDTISYAIDGGDLRREVEERSA